MRFTAGTYTVAESAGAVQVLVVRTGGAQGTVTVDYATSNDTAVAGTDYTATTGTLTFNNNETSKTFTVPVTNNPLPQGSKSFKVTLSHATANSNITSPNVATVTISDNQAASNSSTSNGSAASSSSSSNPAGTIGLSASAYMVNEKTGTLTITVNRDGGSTGAVGVSYGTSNGTAVSGAEYTGVSGTLAFAAGETVKTFVIAINNNPAVTGNKAFSVVIGTPTGGATLGISTASVTIYDNESGAFGSGSIKVAKQNYDVIKSAGYVDIGVQRTGGASGPVSVNYNTTPLSAAAGVDFTSTSGTVTFAPGEATKNVRVYIIKTGSANAGRTFSFDLSNISSSSATMGTPASATVTIDN